MRHVRRPTPTDLEGVAVVRIQSARSTSRGTARGRRCSCTWAGVCVLRVNRIGTGTVDFMGGGHGAKTVTKKEGRA